VKKDADAGFTGLRRPRGRRTVQYVLFAIGCVLLVDALVGDKGVLQMLNKRQALQAQEQELATAQHENARLREEAGRLREDPAAIEDLAREQLLIKPGEKLFIIRDVGPADTRPGEPGK